MGQQYSLFLEQAFRFKFEPNLEEMQRKKRGKRLRIRNVTGHDALFAVYKVLEPPCVTNCKVERSVRHSARVFIPYDELEKVDLYYKPLSTVETAIPGFRLYLYWVLFPTYKPDDPKPSLYSLAFEVKRESGQKPVDYQRLLNLSIKYWPTVRDTSYVNPEFEPIRLGGRRPYPPRRNPHSTQRILDGGHPYSTQRSIRRLKFPPAMPPLMPMPMPMPMPPHMHMLQRWPSTWWRMRRVGGHGCATSADCEGLGYGNTCVEGKCVCRADKECEGIGIVCNKSLTPAIKNPTTQEVMGQCRMRESCGVGRFCPVGFSCSGKISGTCERDLGEFDAQAIAKACLRHPKICYRLGKDTIDIMRTADLRKKGGPGPNAMRKLEDFVLNVIVLFLEDTHSVRDLIVRLNLNEKWLGCLGVSNHDLGDPNRFEDILLTYLEVVAQITRPRVQGFQRELRTASTSESKTRLREEFKQVLREKFYQLKEDLKKCNDKSLFRSRGRCRELAEFALKNFRKCPVFTEFVNPEAGFISRQIAPALRQLIDENMLPNHLDLIPEALDKEVNNNPTKYKNLRLATPNALTRIRVDGITASTDIDVPYIVRSRFFGRTRLASADEVKETLQRRLREPNKPAFEPDSVLQKILQ